MGQAQAKNIRTVPGWGLDIGPKLGPVRGSMSLSPLGLLNFAMQVILKGCSFTSRLPDLTLSVSNLCDQIIVDEGCCSDLNFWSLKLYQWNGISFFYDDIVHSSDSIQFLMDAAPTVDSGRFFQVWQMLTSSTLRARLLFSLRALSYCSRLPRLETLLVTQKNCCAL